MKKFLVAVLVTVSMVASMIPVIAVDNTMTVKFTDITATDTTVLEGETKIMVSVEGAPSDVSILQMYLDFSGDFSYKSIRYLCDTDDITVISPNAASSNAENSVKMGLIDISAGMDLTGTNGTADLFVLTFEGDAGDTMELELNNLEDTWYIAGSINGSKVYPTETVSVTATGSDTTNEAVTAEVKLTMNTVKTFSAASSDGSYVGSGIELKITDESDPSYQYYTILNNIAISKGGHRDATSTIPVFIVTTDLIAGHTYTVELSGIGYITATQTGVTFDETVEFTDEDFMPGDVDGDSDVDQDDYDAFMNVYENVSSNSNLESYATDFNRDGTTDGYDLNILLAVYTPTETEPTATPAATATVKPTATTSTSTSTGCGGGGGGGGGGSSTSTSTATASPEPGETSTPSTDGTDTDTTDNKYFTDLENYSWAEDAIYTLKEKGIINGTSDTTYSPANNIKRGDFIIILVNMLSIDNEYTENFSDVPEDSYYYDQIGKAKAAGVAQGYGEEFMPENSVTRQDLISLAYRAFLDAGYIEAVDDLTALDDFTDKDNVSDYAAAAMAAMVQAGVIHGSDGQLNPKGNATRAETAVMCAALLELMD
ncbi:MAG: S-layer homology domain-containing protein [Oscillospiraceae bacterium]|nr:S-layer homology domain-containing protein [Oscillospiraceae bacterium]